jgi:hypothetical protein
MKKTIAMVWPLAVFVPFVVAAYLYAAHGHAARASQQPLAIAQLSAELARTFSYGLVGADPVHVSRPLRAVAALPAPQAS